MTAEWRAAESIAYEARREVAETKDFAKAAARVAEAAPFEAM